MNRLGVWVMAGVVTMALGGCGKMEERKSPQASPETAAPAESAAEPENKIKMMHDQKEEMQQDKDKHAENDAMVPGTPDTVGTDGDNPAAPEGDTAAPGMDQTN